jgi:hypothetical protein
LPGRGALSSGGRPIPHELLLLPLLLLLLSLVTVIVVVVVVTVVFVVVVSGCSAFLVSFSTHELVPLGR